MRYIVSLAFLAACGSRHDEQPTNSELNVKLKVLDERISSLSLVADSLVSGIGSSFENCDAVELAIEKKICQIAQTANASQQMTMRTQLAIMGKELQTAVFGENCTSAVESGCPADGSVSATLSSVQAVVSEHTSTIEDIRANLAEVDAAVAKIPGIEGQLSSLESRVAALETRMDNFMGSGQSIEMFVATLEADITGLKSQVSAMQGTLSSDKILLTYALCEDNPASGPIYEAILISGDRTKAYGYVKTGTTSGVGLFFKAGDAAKGYTTSLNTRSCRFRMYSDGTLTKVQACWDKTNRSATDAQIDAARSAGTATCTSW